MVSHEKETNPVSQEDEANPTLQEDKMLVVDDDDAVLFETAEQVSYLPLIVVCL